MTASGECPICLKHRGQGALESAGAEHVYAFVFDHIPHHHVHVIARYPGTPVEFSGPSVQEWRDAPRGDAAAVKEFCDRLRSSLRGERS